MQTSRALCQKFKDEPSNIKWYNAGKTKEIRAHTVLPTSDVNAPNPGMNDAMVASATTKIARLMYITNFPNLVVELLS